MNIQIKHSEKGATLIEILIAIVIIVAVLLPSSHIFARFLVTRSTQDKQIAMQAAVNIMESIKTPEKIEYQERDIKLNNREYKLTIKPQKIRSNKIMLTIQVRLNHKKRILARLNQVFFTGRPDE